MPTSLSLLALTLGSMAADLSASDAVGACRFEDDIYSPALNLSLDGPYRDRQEADCTLTGRLSYTGMPFGLLFELKRDGTSNKICIARNGIAATKLKQRAGAVVELTGHFEKLTESEDCAALKYGESLIPCGYCGENVFVASSIKR
ncbi:hypothetical protein [Parvularcula sp. LCG005]|uniref:hypothetical protein n=1 Tax=Parvularcula sp. LCG005 TaxID=3078805 RepID=UPI002941C7BE|nr:hypothetical protein [Parvularcula sp. LCG005]WOI52597.1 hypothetical protein RUI03_10605 [Parvularcula sp. LCG005]